MAEIKYILELNHEHIKNKRIPAWRTKQRNYTISLLLGR